MICAVKALFANGISFLSMCKAEEAKVDTKSKANEVEEKDEISKVSKKFSRDATVLFQKMSVLHSLSVLLFLILSLILVIVKIAFRSFCILDPSS